MSHYDTLGVSRGAPEAVIQAAYRALIRRAHPDVGGDPAQAQALNDAYAVLGSQSAREMYDRELRAQETQTTTGLDPVPARGTTTAGHAEPQGESLRGTGPVSLTYSMIPAPRRWWKTPLAWVPLLAVLLLTALCSPFIGEGALLVAMTTAGALMSPLIPHRGTRVVGWVLALAPPVLFWLRPSADTGLVLLALVPAVSAFVALGLWAVARRRERKQALRHLGDVLETTSEIYSLPIQVVNATEPLSNGRTLVHLDVLEGVPAWPLPTAVSTMRVEAGDLITADNGKVILVCPPGALRVR